MDNIGSRITHSKLVDALTLAVEIDVEVHDVAEVVTCTPTAAACVRAATVVADAPVCAARTPSLEALVKVI